MLLNYAGWCPRPCDLNMAEVMWPIASTAATATTAPVACQHRQPATNAITATTAATRTS